MRKCWVWLGASLLLATAAPAAVVREHRVTVEVQPNGTVRERVSLRVRIDNGEDLARWSPYPIYLDANRRLLRLEAAGTPPGGRPLAVKRKGRDRVGVPGEGILHASAEVELVEFPAVPDGSELSLDYEVEEQPYYRSGVQPLGGEDPVESLRVEVHAPGLRARLADVPPGVTVSEQADRVLVTGAVPAHGELERAPSTSWPALRYSWGGEADWKAVGSWYRDLVATVPRNSAAVRETARRLAAGTTDRRQLVERLLAFVRRDVRYVAVEIGIGGYRPGSPEEVLGRRWGDCKDKAMLLVDLLAALGIDGHLVLVRADDEGGIDPDFPAPDQFNHAIVALPASALPPASGARPAAGAWIFLDATQPTGGLSWMSPAVAGQHALVVTPAGGELAVVPLVAASESERLTLVAEVAADGSARGDARLELDGRRAAALARMASSVDAADVIARASELLAAEVPGGAFDKVALWSADDGPPKGRVTATLQVASMAVANGDEISLLLPAQATWPSPAITEDRALPVVLTPGVRDAEWRLRLPRDGCRLEAAATVVDKPLGSFRQEVELAGSTLVVRRHSEVRARLASPAQLEQLEAIATAEHRALRRRLRLSCSGG